MKESVIQKYTDATVDKVWNIYTKNMVPNNVVKKWCNEKKMTLSDDEKNK